LLPGSGIPRIVFDTNALLSLFVFADSKFAPLRGEVEAGRWQALTDERCLAEFRRVLGYPMFALDAERQASAFAAWRNLAIVPPPPQGDLPPLPACKDRDDQKFLELARNGQADCLVTSDKALLKLARRRKLAHLFRIVTPEVLLLELFANNARGTIGEP
jgi:putative PIN family toxin of toxin-antitoxin system